MPTDEELSKVFRKKSGTTGRPVPATTIKSIKFQDDIDEDVLANWTDQQNRNGFIVVNPSRDFNISWKGFRNILKKWMGANNFEVSNSTLNDYDYPENCLIFRLMPTQYPDFIAEAMNGPKALQNGNGSHS